MKKLGSKSTPGNGILLTLALLLPFFITLVFASQGFELYPDRETYYPTGFIEKLGKTKGAYFQAK